MEALVKVRNISKAFHGVKALDQISVDFYPGRVHVLLGENGAGKSTLIKIISGVYQCDEGQIFIAGQENMPRNPREGIDSGISVIHQELSIVGDLSVAENIFLAHHQKTRTPVPVDEIRGAYFFYVRIILNVGEILFKPEIGSQITSSDIPNKIKRQLREFYGRHQIVRSAEAHHYSQ